MSILNFFGYRDKTPKDPYLSEGCKLTRAKENLEAKDMDRYRNICGLIDRIVRYSTAKERPSLITDLTFRTYIEFLQLKKTERSQSFEQQQLNEIISVLANDSNNEAHQFITQLGKYLGMTQLKGCLEKLVEQKVNLNGNFLHCANLVLRNFATEQQMLTNLLSLAHLASKNTPSFDKAFKHGLFDNLFSIPDKDALPGLFRELDRLANKMLLLDEENISVINNILTKLSAGARSEALRIFDEYHGVGSDEYHFREDTLTFLAQCTKDQLEKFFNTLKSLEPIKAFSFFPDLLIEYIKNNISLDRKPIFKNLASVGFINNDLDSKFIQRVRLNPRVLKALLDPKVQFSERGSIALTAILIHNFKPEEIALISNAVGNSYSASDPLCEIFSNEIFNGYKTSKPRILLLAKAIEAICNGLKKENLEQLGKSSAFSQLLTKLNSKKLDKYLIEFAKFCNSDSAQSIIINLDTAVNKHGLVVLADLLRLVFLYQKRNPDHQLDINLISKFMAKQSLEKINSLFAYLRQNQNLTSNKQELLMHIIQNQEHMQPSTFEQMTSNFSALAYDEDIMTNLNFALDELELNPDHLSKDSIRGFSSLALYCFVSQSGTELLRNCQTLNKLNKLNKSIFQETEIVNDILIANKDRPGIKIDLQELENQTPNTRTKLAYRIARISSKLDYDGIKRLISLRPSLQGQILSLLEKGELNALIQAYKDSNFDEVILNFLPNTKLYKKYIQDHPLASDIEQGTKSLIRLAAFPAAIESYVKKITNSTTIKTEQIHSLTREMQFQALIANIAMNINHDYPVVAEEIRKMNEDERIGLFYDGRLDSPPVNNSEYQTITSQSYDINAGVYDIHHGFGPLGFESRRISGADFKEDSALLRAARDFGNSVKHFNASSSEKFPGKGFLIDGINQQAMFGFPREFHSEDERETFSVVKNIYANFLPWLAPELNDMQDTKYIFLRGMMAIIPPKTAKYNLPGARFKHEHYSLVVYNDHFESDANSVAYLVPTKILEDKLNPCLVNDEDYTGFNPGQKDLTQLSLKINNLNGLAEITKQNILNLGWVSNVGGGMCNAYPVESEPYYGWEKEANLHTKDFVGHIHKTHIDGKKYQTDYNTLIKDPRFFNLKTAHDEVYKVSKSLVNLMQGFKLAMSLRHKGLSSYSEVPGKPEMDISDQKLEIKENDELEDSDLATNPYIKYMLYEAYKWHNNLHSQARYNDVVAKKENFPVLAVSPTFSWALAPDQDHYLDTYDMTLHLRNSQPEKIIEFKKLHPEQQEKYWGEYFANNEVIPSIGKDIRLLDRVSVNAS